MGWRTIKEQSRREVHAAFSYAADYLAPGAATPASVNVRIHEKEPVDAGRIETGWAGNAELPTRAIFDPDEVVPERLGTVELEDGRKYRVDRLLPQDGQYQPCEVVRL